MSDLCPICGAHWACEHRGSELEQRGGFFVVEPDGSTEYTQLEALAHVQEAIARIGQQIAPAFEKAAIATLEFGRKLKKIVDESPELQRLIEESR